MRTIALLALALVVAGCEDTVSSARCSACTGVSYSAIDCARWAAEAGCASHEFLPTVEGGCTNGCSFTDCERQPECGPGVRAPDAFVPDLDPACIGGGVGSCQETAPAAMIRTVSR